MGHSSALVALGIGIVAFTSTNIDDIFILSAFFADRRLTSRAVVIGQFVGIGALVAASAVAAFAAITVPAGWVALLGIVPLALGARKLWLLQRRGVGDMDSSETADLLKSQEARIERRTRSQILAVTGVTVANGGDNLGVYIPLFASDLRMIPVYACVFAVLTAVWCGIGYGLVNNRVAGQYIRRYGHIALPFVLVGLGLYILSGALVLLGPQ